MPVFRSHLGNSVILVNAATGAAGRRALQACGIPVSYGAWRDYWSRTGNALENAVADVPGGVWRARKTDPREASDFTKLTPKR